MASSPLTPIVSAFDLTTSWQEIYSVPSDKLRTGIDASVFNNYTGSNATYSVRIVQSGTATILNELISSKLIRANSSDLGQEIIGQAVETGGTIEAKASANSSISVNITGTIVDS